MVDPETAATPPNNDDERTSTTIPVTPTLTPSIKLLFSLLSRRHILLFLIPAIVCAVISGGVAPFMTYVIGQAFDGFARFPTSSPTQDDKNALLHSVGVAALQLVGLAAASLALSSITSSLWIWTGEQNAMAIRKVVYQSVTSKDIHWFDSNTHGDAQAQQDAPIGAGGLMSKFTNETDQVRMASSLAAGMVLQYATTTLTCLILAFTRSYQLTLVILSAVPVLIFIQGLSQGFAGPLLAVERTQSAVAATRIDRAIAAISTVKAFNASVYEQTTLATCLDALNSIGRRLFTVWGATSGLSQFVTMSMFVQGFWFGSKLIRDGKVSPGDVMAVFWACLIATSNLQMCIPQLITLTKGKFAAVALLSLAQDAQSPPPPSPSAQPQTPTSPSSVFTQSTYTLPHSKSQPRALRKIAPTRCLGEFTLAAIDFSYPSRPTVPILKDVSLFLPARETTFIVGGSGSGKSTVASLLLGLYRPQSGTVLLDDRDASFLDSTWLRHHVMGVSQGEGVVFGGMSVHDNVAVALSAIAGSSAARITREQVVEACTKALLHDFVRGLPDGYDTILAGSTSMGATEVSDASEGGVGLSGGQRQRLAIARAILRDPSVLILDEATSALDPTSRLLVFEALKRSRENRTTIVITHDLSQIGPDDFVYVMREGEVVEQGFRVDLERGVAEGQEGVEEGVFREMLRVQMGMGGFLPTRNIDSTETPSSTAPIPAPEITVSDPEKQDPYTKEDFSDVELSDDSHDAPQTRLRPLTQTLGNWMFEVVADLTRTANGPGGTLGRLSMIGGPAAPGGARESRFGADAFRKAFADAGVAVDAKTDDSVVPAAGKRRKARPTSIAIPSSPVAVVPVARARPETRRLSLQFTPTSPVFSLGDGYYAHTPGYGYAEEEWALDSAVGLVHSEEAGEQDDALKRYARVEEERRRRRQRAGGRKRWDSEKAVPPTLSIKVDPKRRWGSRKGGKSPKLEPTSDDDAAAAYPFWTLVRSIYPTVPHKPIVALGLLICLCSGAMTPIFSFLLSRLLFEASTGADNTKVINYFGGIVLGIAALDGLLIGLKYFVMESTALAWVTRIRKLAFARVLAQDRKFFDRATNSPARIVQILVKDGEDAANLIAVVAGQCLVVVAMLSVGLVWALARGWQLTLAGFAIAPVFAGTMAVQTRLVAKCELRNKRAREEVAKGYYEAISNIRCIRAMSFENIFKTQFDNAADCALSTGVRGAFVEGCTYGVSSALIYLAEALLFYVGAVLIANGTYTYLQMVEVLNLVVFSVTIGSQLMAFTERIAKSTQATRDFNQLLQLSSDTDESRGVLRPQLMGSVTFNNVSFSYPERKDVQVLKNLNLEIADGECVAVVGASGCGKSTIAALLQRLYEPESGVIAIGLNELRATDVYHLRQNVSVVSQNPNLFDATVAENITYGNESLTEMDVRRAAKAAHVHDFVMSLPQGYDTPIGENASLISGGQAQRLQIARALARPSRILILDECTSALDAQNQAAVLETIRDAKVGRTTIMVTHKVPVMRMCDRIVLVHEGAVVEHGTYDELMERKGVFATLASGGEWVGE
ncbi:hypothetical protein HGRIS_012223 [Hohenbuehelia grisea]|uniref:P-loop containing nucleoside triphosphate hydrolase protein n=1 Tax=Hohenbuehelia grisea TaxID=104357 RepID=A0ABR3IRQ8_9AGAR